MQIFQVTAKFVTWTPICITNLFADVDYVDCGVFPRGRV